jgi:type I restriction enzyme S subunit
MNAERLLAYYEHIFDAPDAIARLRRFILDLAVRGKLVLQDPNDEPASELLKRIATEKALLVRAGQIRNFSAFLNIERELEPFALPNGWLWTRLGDVLTKLTDGTHHSPPNEPAGDFKYITAKNIKEEGVSLAEITYVSRKIHEEIYSRCNPVKGDILYIKDGATTGIVTINDLDEPFSMLSSVALLKLPNCVFNRLIVAFLRSPFFFDQMRGFMKGVAITRVTLNRMAPALLPLPPAAEQRRIVAKVDELMALCDRLEAARKAGEATRDRLTTASLARFNEPDSKTFQADACFALDALPALTARPEQIKQLRQTILNLAVRGRLSAEGAWRSAPVKLSDVASLQNGYAFKSEWFSKSGTRLLRNANVGHGVLNWNDEVCLPETQVPDYERFRLYDGDVVLSLDRPFIVTGTKVARVKTKDLPALLLQRVGRFVLSPELDPDYLCLWINSPHFSTQIDPGRSNGVPHISSKQVEAAMLFLPPLAEQHRIVAKVDVLMALCGRLEASLTATSDTRHRLLDALLIEALEPVKVRELEAAE